MLGARTLLLCVALANGVLLAGLIAVHRTNRVANVVLASLILLVTARLGPYALGFAGFYDAHRWLTFLPLDLSLAFGPLLWAYVVALTGGSLRRFAPHLAPAAVQLAYWISCFALPLDLKWAWYVGEHLHRVAPAGLALGLASGAAYLALAWRRYAAYQRWLDATYADREPARLAWLRAMLGLFALAIVASVALALFTWVVRPTSYLQRFPIVVGWAGLAYALGMLGWRYGAVRLPAMQAVEAEAEAVPAEPERRTDYGDAFRGWAARAVAEGWAREEGLTAALVASRLHVSQRTLSRTLAEGGGVTFNAFINGLRLEAVARALSDPADRRDLLQVAFDAGFQSKASFNRAFQQAHGMSPSAYRAQARERLTIRQSERLAEVAAPPGR